MAKEIHAQTTTGWTVYAVLINATGQAWNGTTWETLAGANWATYDIAMTEAAAGVYLGNMPAVVAGTYTALAYRQIGGAPATTDTLVDEQAIAWTGSAVAAPGGAAYASVAQLRELLPQVPTGATNDALLLTMLERATALIDGELGFSFAALGAVATAKDVLQRRASAYLDLPPYGAGTITSVYAVYSKGSSSEDTDEIEATEYDILDDTRLYYASGWAAGWYRVTAIWGAGSAPTDIVQVCLEKAINLWGARDSRQISDVIGVEGGGAVGYQRAWTNMQRSILQNVRVRFGQFGFA